MAEKYYIMHNPLIFNLMDLHGNIQDIHELLAHLTGKDVSQLDSENYLDFLRFDLRKERQGMVETFGMESYASHYIANQIARLRPDLEVVLSDGKRKTLDRIIQERGKPEAVFITSMSSNFPTAAATTISLNHAEIPVVIGGIHVSTSPDDIDTFVRSGISHPELVSQVRGAGDSATLKQVLHDVRNGGLSPEYIGYETMEDGIWGAENVVGMDKNNLAHLSRIPIVGWLGKYFSVNVSTPYLGCPYSCNFCSISSLDKNQRKFKQRSSEDFIEELEQSQSQGVNLQNRAYFFLPDNLLIGGRRLENTLEKMIDSDLKVNYAAQISIDVANKPSLLEKLRLSGATHFFIGLESLDLRNLEAIGKNAVKEIKQSGLSVKDYYSQQIRKIQDHGISVHGAFIFGLPFDYFNGLNNHSGVDVSEFCREQHIGVQTTCLTDLPGSKDFMESQKLKRGLYGQKEPMDYLVSLCTCDIREGNRKVPYDSLHQSSLVVAHMAYDTARRVGSNLNALSNGLFMMRKAFKSPTMKGKRTFIERGFDTFAGLGSQVIVAMEKEHHESVAYSTDSYRGSFERLYEAEKNPEVKEMFKDFVQQFK